MNKSFRPPFSSFLRLLAALAVGFGSLSLFSGCNTAEGFGQDVEATGEAISEEANELND